MELLFTFKFLFFSFIQLFAISKSARLFSPIKHIISTSFLLEGICLTYFQVLRLPIGLFSTFSILVRRQLWNIQPKPHRLIWIVFYITILFVLFVQQFFLRMCQFFIYIFTERFSLLMTIWDGAGHFSLLLIILDFVRKKVCCCSSTPHSYQFPKLTSLLKLILIEFQNHLSMILYYPFLVL